MDAETVAVRVERVTEPFSGMPLVRVAGHWEGPPSAAPTGLEVRYDAEPATRSELIPAEAPPGRVRLNFGTQLPVEDAAVVEVALTGPAGERSVYRRPFAEVGNDTVPPPEPGGFAARAWRSVASGEVLSPWRWKARAARFADKLLELRQKVRYRLLARRFRDRDPHDAYAENTAITPRARAAMADEISRFRRRPTISVLVPVYNVDPKWLRRAVESVTGQAYPNWELCLADDASTRPDLKQYLDRLPSDPRIKLVRRPANGHICEATNSAADLATGEFVALLDNDDELAPDALFEIARLLQDHPDADLVYSDEDKIDAAGRRYDPQFKPDWSPELLLSYNYVNHFTCVRRSVFEKAGRFRPGFEGSQDHDLLLRVTELTDRVHHVPRILYHWRALPESTASAATVKEYVHTSGRRAVEGALSRRGVSAAPFVPPFAKRLGLPVLALDGPDDGPAVAVVIRGDADAARRTVRAVRSTTAYRNYTDYLVIDDATPAEALNRTAAGRTEEFLLFLEAGAEPTDPRWLSRLVANARLPGVGTAGGLTRDAGGAVVSAGVVTGMHDGTAPADAFAGLTAEAISYYFYAEVTRNVAAVSGRCLLTPRAVFERVGGFDARRYPRSLWDVDYGLRVRGQGLRCVHVGGAELRAAGGGRRDRPTELLALRHAYGRPADPYHNPNCSERHAFRPACDAPLSLPSEATRPPVRALVAAHNLNNPEGAPRYLSEIVLGLKARGWVAPTVFSPHGGPGAAVYTDTGVVVDIRSLSAARRFVDGVWSPREYEAAQRGAARLLRDHRPEIVIANTLTTFPLVEAAARAGIPSVWIIHESYSAGHLARLFPPFARGRVEMAFRLASRVVPASHDTAALFGRLNTRGNFRVFHNGLDPRPFDDYRRAVSREAAARRLPGLGGRKAVVAVGTVCERKGQHTLVQAAAELAKTRDDFAVYLVGARGGVPYADYVRDLIARRRLGGRVFLVPETDDAWAFYRAADVFVCTSHMETFSRAVLEAEAFGLPVVSTPVHGVPEQVYWGDSALSFGFGDAAGLARELGRVLGDGALRAEMGRQSRAAFDNHLNHEEMLDRYGGLILAAARHGPRAKAPYHPAAAPPARRAA